MMTSPFKGDILAGKVALVTGGTSGIGLEIARQLGSHGAIVAVSGRRQNVLNAACTELQSAGIQNLGLQGDVRDAKCCESWVQQTVERFGQLDILVNCAAGNFLATAEQLTQNGFKTVMEIDAVGTFTMCRSAFEALRKSSNPIIINISATFHYAAAFWQIHCASAKAAVDAITRSLALEWGEFGIRVTGVAPGPIEGTAGLTKLSGGAAAEQLQRAVIQEIPLGHMGQRWDIGMACVFLASEAARYVSGHTLVVDGAGWIYRTPFVPREVVSKVSRQVEGSSRKVGTAAPTSKL